MRPFVQHTFQNQEESNFAWDYFTKYDEYVRVI